MHKAGCLALEKGKPCSSYHMFSSGTAMILLSWENFSDPVLRESESTGPSGSQESPDSVGHEIHHKRGFEQP